MHIIVSILKTFGIVLLVELLWASAGMVILGLVMGAMAGFSNEGPLYAEDAIGPLVIGAVGIPIFAALALRYRELANSRVAYWTPAFAVFALALFGDSMQSAAFAFGVLILLKLIILFPNQRSSYGT
ncbi:MAG TPA: hypothetical protein VHB93_01550 [Candidatus Paceibacterota bacterium]|nr:hypothetical protein [Candidatus Paceibacterota bacterium]